MITRVKVKNFRSLADVDVTLGPLTVLVGRNGAGKSAFVDVLRFVRDAIRLNLNRAVMERGGISSLRRWSPPKKRPYDIEICLTAETRTFWGEYSFALESDKQGEFRIREEKCQVGIAKSQIIEGFEIRNGKMVAAFGDLFTQDLHNRPVDPTVLVMSTIYVFSTNLVQLYSSLAHTDFYTIFPNILRAPQKPMNERWLAENGENLASVLQQLKKGGRWFPDLLSALDHIVGDVSDLRVRQAGGYLITELQHQVQNGTAPWFALEQESDGTLRILGLLAGLYHDVERTLIAIEEPETALHPGALGVLSDILREASLRSQILITTQSPDLISCFGVDELRVVERADGITQIGLIDEVQRKVLNEQLFSAGDLLRIEDLHRATEDIVEAKSA